MDKLISIGELSSSLGISIRTIRYYEEIGLLAPHLTSESNYRYYSDQEKDVLVVILFLKKMGLSLREIKNVLLKNEPDLFLSLLNGQIEELKQIKEDVLLKQEVLETVLTQFSGDPLEAIRLAMKKTNEINNFLPIKASVKILGIGSKQEDLLNRLATIDENLGVIYISMEGDTLSASIAKNSIQLQGTSRELAIQEEMHQIKRAIKDAELLYILADCEDSSAQSIAKEAQELGILTFGVFTDFASENKVDQKVQELIDHVDLLFDFPIKCTVGNDELILDSVKCLSSLILDSYIDNRDIQTIARNKGRTRIAIGNASGPNKINDVMDHLFSSPLLDKSIIENASCGFLSIKASSDLTIPDVDVILNILRNKVGLETNIIFGTAIDNKLIDTIMVSLLLTGYDKKDLQSSGQNFETLIYRKDLFK